MARSRRACPERSRGNPRDTDPDHASRGFSTTVTSATLLMNKRDSGRIGCSSRQPQVQQQSPREAPPSPLSSRAKPRDLQFPRPRHQGPWRRRIAIPNRPVKWMRVERREGAGSGQDDKWTTPERLNCRSLGFARDDKGEDSAFLGCDGGNDSLTGLVHSSPHLAADKSGGMTKGRVALSLGSVAGPAVPSTSIQFDRNPVCSLGA